MRRLGSDVNLKAKTRRVLSFTAADTEGLRGEQDGLSR
jgi:hypothetical protein